MKAGSRVGRIALRNVFSFFEHDFDKAFHGVPPHGPCLVKGIAIGHEAWQGGARNGVASLGLGLENEGIGPDRAGDGLYDFHKAIIA